MYAGKQISDQLKGIVTEADQGGPSPCRNSDAEISDHGKSQTSYFLDVTGLTDTKSRRFGVDKYIYVGLYFRYKLQKIPMNKVIILFNHSSLTSSPLLKVGDVMACGQPLKAIRLFDDTTGRNKIIFDSTAFDTGFYHGSWIAKDNRLLIPCGQCTSCRIQKSREWANRLMMELQDHDSAYFVTLTYDEEHAPRAVDEYGEVKDWYTLQKRDVQLFMKRLRKKIGFEPEKQLRFYLCGEYGTETFRPHYHAIIFNLHLDDLIPYKKSRQGFMYYNSPFLDSVWTQDGKKIGYVVVAEVTWETCAYVARYVTKKLQGPLKEYYDLMSLEPPFSLMSRRPGIAHNYYEKNKDHIFQEDFINLSTDKGGLKFTPPKYFKNLGLKDDNYARVEDLALLNKKMADEATLIKLSKTTYTLDQLLEVEDRNLENRVKSLRRNII